MTDYPIKISVVHGMNHYISIKDAFALVDNIHKQIESVMELGELKRSSASPVASRCPNMLPNEYGYEQCGRKRGHEGKCCYLRGD